MLRASLLIALFSLLPRLALAEVTILSADTAPAVSVAADREFACETLPWTDPDPAASQPDLLFYQVVGATGPVWRSWQAGATFAFRVGVLSVAA